MSDKLFYSISEVAGMFEVNPSLIRFWEKKFDIISPQKNKMGKRFFTNRDIDDIQLIFHLVKEKGMTLDGAKQKIKDNKHSTEHNLKVILKLRKMKLLLNQMKQDL